MANMMRWRYGDTNPRLCAVDSATVIEIGDLVYLDTDDVKPATSQADATSPTLNQQAFHDKFAGVAAQASAAGDTDDIRVDTTGVFEFDAASATFEIGDLIGAAENGTGDGILNQTVIAAVTPAATEGIGTVAKREPSAVTKVLVDIQSTLLSPLQGVQAVQT